MSTPVIEFKAVSKWYGNVIGLNHVSLQLQPGVVGLLGPNGAGKSTLLQLATGQIRPSQGRVRVLGCQPWSSPGLNRWIGLCPEQDAFYEWMTAKEFVRTCAILSGFSGTQAMQLAVEALERVNLLYAMDRPIRGYSKGMRQRTKIAQAIVHNPDVLFLDEPLTGTDPIARRDIIEIIKGLGRAGKSVIMSSHVLHEIQSVTSNVVVINRGKLVAQGDTRHIRDLIDKYPHRINLRSARYRDLAGRLMQLPDVVAVKVDDPHQSIAVDTRKPDDLYSLLPTLSLDEGYAIEEVHSADDSLEAVFKFLVN